MHKRYSTPLGVQASRMMMLIAAVALMCVMLAACGSSSNAGSTAKAAAMNGEPTFSGPYAAEFKQEYEKAPTDLVRNILKDGTITQTEVQEAYDAYNKCLEPYGLQATWNAEQGESMGQFRGSMSDDEQLKIMDQCHAKTGAGNISSLYIAMQNNPDHVDQVDLERKVYQCYAKHDLLPSPISENDYMSTMSTVGLTDKSQFETNLKRWHEFFGEYMSTTFDGQPNPNYKYDQNSAKGQQFWACQSDPLHQ
ncbi:hypothetical protein [Bifidobacterium cebidarum]|uniref:Lipoprotein n=1 Tax=Bifidobacterium cebidarum TaxID=2650773 RepID=A0A6I1GAE6_9BIFI|nr:hypothetical protein [Bifidobacterium cebidarum]KAB7788515.1 hypothetical protein F7D08_0794 [Bifidobacterium cebidarum]